MYKMLVPFLMVSSAIYAAEANPMAAVCERLVAALGQETAALTRMQSEADVDAALDDLRASLDALKEQLAVDQKELWLYIDNTEGVKQPIIDELERLALQFARVQQAGFFNNAQLRELLAPQLITDPEAQRAKLEKLQEIDHDED